MYAVIRSGGKQYKVSVGQNVEVEKLDGEVGANVNFEVLLLSKDDGEVVTGKPVVKDVVCKAQIVAQDKQDKVIVFKYKPKKNERKKQGHRQPFTKVKILSIE